MGGDASTAKLLTDYHAQAEACGSGDMLACEAMASATQN